jgi:hypothetical protein
VLEHYYGKTKNIDIDKICSIKILSHPDIRINFGERNEISNHIYIAFSSYGQKSIGEYIRLKNIFQDFLNFVIADKVTTIRMLGEIQTQVNHHFIIEQVEIFIITEFLKN